MARLHHMAGRWRRLTTAFAVCGAAVLSAARAQGQPAPTFSRDIAPLFFAHCAPCHRPGEAGGFSLLTFADARPRAAAIARAVRSGAMPPWKPDRIAGAELVGDRRLEQAEIARISQWVEAGAPEGNPRDLPSPPRFPDGWQLGSPDLVVEMGAPFVVPAGGADILRNVVIPLKTDRTRYVRGLEFRPDNRSVVHHANIRVDRSHTARALDAADAAPGFDGRLSGGAEFPDGQFLGWTPGQLPPLLSRDAAWRVEANSDLVVQLHLRPRDVPTPVRVRIGLFFSDDAPQRTPAMVRLGRQNLDIPAGAANYQVDDSYRLPVEASLLAVQPHAHYRAREVTAWAELPGGRVMPLLHIAHWDFDWQDQYRFVSPIRLPAGTVLRMTYRYDNSAANPRNPDYPPRRVRWGQNSDDEMGDVWFQLVTPDEPTRRVLLEDCGRKVLAEDAVGFETLLQSEPANPRLHEAVAAIALTLGDVARGVRHLEVALALDAKSVEAHYNLATARAWQGDTAGAIAQLQTVLALDPDHVGAHVNLGALMRRRGDLAGATASLSRAVALDPKNAAAHVNLAGVFVSQGAMARAVVEYEAALATSPSLVEALTELAWTRATSPSASIRNPAAAVGYAERAAARTSRSDARALDALAAAYAAGGRYRDAVTTLDEALALIPAGAADADESRRLLEERRALYRSRRAFVDPAREEAGGRGGPD